MGCLLRIPDERDVEALRIFCARKHGDWHGHLGHEATRAIRRYVTEELLRDLENDTDIHQTHGHDDPDSRE